MRTSMQRFISLSFFVAVASSVAAFGQPRGSGYQRLLVPIAIQGEIPGALGSLWATRVAITNASVGPVDILGYDWSGYGCVSICAEPPLTPAGITFLPPVSPGKQTQGAILLVEPRHASDVAVDLRVQDVSRQSQTWGTQIPVVAESGLFQHAFQLLNIPVGAEFRGMLRLYDVDAHDAATVRLRFYTVNPSIDVPFKFSGPQPQADTLLRELMVSLQAERRPGTPLFDLAYGELSLSDLAEIQGKDRIRIEVTPITLGLRVWAFVSVTNNETQHVTTVAPQS